MFDPNSANSRESGENRPALLWCRRSRAAKRRTFATHAAVVLHRVFRFASHDCDLPAAMIAFVFGADGKPLFMAFARRTYVLRVAYHRRLTGTANHHDRVVGLYRFGFLDRGNGSSPIPEFWRRTGVSERSEHAKSSGRED